MRLILMLLILHTTLYAQRTGGWIGGELQLSIRDESLTSETRSFAGQEKTFSISLRPYWLRQQNESSAWGLGLLTALEETRRIVGGNEVITRTFTLGGRVFWRFRLYQPANSKLQLGLEPGIFASSSRGRRNSFNSNGANSRSFSMGGLISPYLFFPFSDKFRGIIRAQGFLVSYTSAKDDISESQIQILNDFSLNLNPTTWTFGFEWRLSGKD
ncbi:MAG: hypothetical protein AAGF87_10015 [Bacteroidota bacterium]